MTLLELLNIETGASNETLMRIISSAPRRYKVYEIAKRRGGTRTIAHPARELKALQRVILRQILDKIPASQIATAYVRDRGILYNARQHVKRPWLLKLDFRNFFHSIEPRDWDRAVRLFEELRRFSRDREIFHRLLFWGGGQREPRYLSIGAPTSPSVSNLVCIALDQWMIEQASRLDVRVTRYADDITVSADTVAKLLRFERLFRTALANNTGVALELNDEKRGLYGPGERRMVTGLILTPDGKISIGRERKREISALVHRFALGTADNALAMRAKGLLAFALSVEPAFFTSMQKKYGLNVIAELMRVEAYIQVPDLGIEF